MLFIFGCTCRRRHWAQGEHPADPKLPTVLWWRRTPCWRNFLSCPGYGLTHTHTQTKKHMHPVKSSETQQHKHTLFVGSKTHTCKFGTFNHQDDQRLPADGLCCALFCIRDLTATTAKRSRSNTSVPSLIPEESWCRGEDDVQQVAPNRTRAACAVNGPENTWRC